MTRKKLKIEDLVFLSREVSSQKGVDYYIKRYREHRRIPAIEVMHCIHDQKTYLRDGMHKTYVSYNIFGIKELMADIYQCTDTNWQYGFDEGTCILKELCGTDRYTIKDLIVKSLTTEF